MTILVLGVGHPDRGDDAAGAMVARQLQGRSGIEACVVTGDPSQTLTDPRWNSADRVVLVDTVHTGRRPGTVHRWSGQRLLDHLPATGGGTHDLGVATTLHLAAALDRLPRDLTIIGIEGECFEVGHPPCRPVRHAARVVAEALARGAVDGADSGAAGDGDEVAIPAADLPAGGTATER